jgi:hypothetical protein
MRSYSIATRCIFRDSKHKPFFLFVVDYDKDFVGVNPKKGACSNPLWLPREYVFMGDERLFAELLEAWSTKDEKRLCDLWSKALPWEPDEDRISK